ncbi:MAG TPA: hypothetical protein VF244_10290, partial [Acidimicrobiales bacterium]
MTAAVVLALAVVALGAALRGAVEANRRSPVSARLPATARPSAHPGRLRLRPPPPPWLEAALVDAAVDVPAATAWVGWLGGTVVVALATAVVAGVPAAVLAAGAVAGVPP